MALPLPEAAHTADATYTAIRAQILSGERAGGDWLREEDLATALGVSRTPVREALRRLAAEGLVRHERHRGVQVVEWSTGDLDELFGLRALLEPWGCGLAAARGEVDLDALTALADRMDAAAARRTPDLDVVTELNNRFHRTILEASGNSRLVGLVAAVVEVPLVTRTFSLYTPEALRRSLAHHHEIVDALRAGDREWAESVMRSHVRAAWSSLAGRVGHIG
ncbi:MAG: GntR family transcriptional regulator [Phycicoccus sp.]